jgi:large subunit ribosomal protein L3
LVVLANQKHQLSFQITISFISGINNLTFVGLIAGFKRYGVIKGNYVLIEGSVPGSKKRLVMLRPAIRPTKVKLLIPEIKEIVI